jgi:hypothetical protein
VNRKMNLPAPKNAGISLLAGLPQASYEGLCPTELHFSYGLSHYIIITKMYSVGSWDDRSKRIQRIAKEIVVT